MRPHLAQDPKLLLPGSPHDSDRRTLGHSCGVDVSDKENSGEFEELILRYFKNAQEAFHDNFLLSKCCNESFKCCSAAQFPMLSWSTSDLRPSWPVSACLLEPLSCTRHGSLPAPCSCHIQSDLQLQRSVHTARHDTNSTNMTEMLPHVATVPSFAFEISWHIHDSQIAEQHHETQK